MPKKPSRNDLSLNNYPGYFSSSGPLAVKGGGIKAKSTQGAIGATWWSKRWIGVLESFGMGNRLTRGRTYARKGQVASLEIGVGQVQAKVQGSQPQPYRVMIKLKPLSDLNWDKITSAMAQQAIFAAKLLAGEMPQNIEEAFGAANVSLMLVSERDLETSCTCPDWANPCKHIAAVYYLLAENFDADPFLIFKLRGRTKEQIVATLREKWTENSTKTANVKTEESENQSFDPTIEFDQNLKPLDETLDTFWQIDSELLENYSIKIEPPEIDNALLKRLGEAPFKVVGSHSITPILAKAYEIASKAALKKAAE